MKISGRIKIIGQTQTFGNNGFRKRDLVIETLEKYSETILIEFVQDKTDLLNGYQVGAEVEVSINLRGREWTNPQGQKKYFNSIQGWRVQTITNNNPPVSSESSLLDNLTNDDIPFL